MNNYETILDGHVLTLEDQLAMIEAWFYDSPWYEAEIAEITARIAERDAALAA